MRGGISCYAVGSLNGYDDDDDDDDEEQGEDQREGETTGSDRLHLRSLSVGPP